MIANRKQVFRALWGAKSACNFSRVINHLRGGNKIVQIKEKCLWGWTDDPAVKSMVAVIKMEGRYN